MFAHLTFVSGCYRAKWGLLTALAFNCPCACVGLTSTNIIYIVVFNGFLDHTDGLLLMTQRCEATEGQVVGPVETAIVGWMFHPRRPVVLTLQVLGELLSTHHVLLVRLLLLHERAVEHLHLLGLCILSQVHLVHHIVQLLRISSPKLMKRCARFQIFL